MSRGTFLIIGAAIGAAAAMALNYFLGPAPETTYDAGYRSRLDFALDEGRRAAAERDKELRLQIKQMRSLGSNFGKGAPPA